MWLTAVQESCGWHPYNYGGVVSCAGSKRHHATLRRVFTGLALLVPLILSPLSSKAQQVNQPGFDPRQTEKKFDGPESDQAAASRSGLKMPLLSRPEVQADSTPLFDLRQVSLSGARAMPIG